MSEHDAAYYDRQDADRTGRGPAWRPADYHPATRQPGSVPGCIGSGQLVGLIGPAPVPGPFSAAWDTCPACGRRVEIVRMDGLDAIAPHLPAVEPSRNGSARPIGESFGF